MARHVELLEFMEKGSDQIAYIPDYQGTVPEKDDTVRLGVVEYRIVQRVFYFPEDTSKHNEHKVSLWCEKKTSNNQR